MLEFEESHRYNYEQLIKDFFPKITPIKLNNNIGRA